MCVSKRLDSWLTMVDKIERGGMLSDSLFNV